MKPETKKKAWGLDRVHISAEQCMTQSVLPGTWAIQKPIELVRLEDPQTTIRNNSNIVRKDSNMFYDDTDNEMSKEARSENYLTGRLNSIMFERSDDLERAFGLRDNPSPDNPKDLIDRITSGKYWVPQDKMEKNDYNVLKSFRWRDPNVKEDKAGYAEAIKTLNKACTDAQDMINIGTPAEGLAALKTFESTTFH